MSFVRIWVHVVFSTKNRNPWLKSELKTDVCKYIIGNCKNKGIFLQAVDGYTDHLHCLISLGRTQSIADTVQHIKGESSFWINSTKIVDETFSWQDDYFAVSVGESQVKRVVNYIKNQEGHHAKKSFDEEVKEFNKAYGWTLIKDQLAKADKLICYPAS